MLARSVKFIAHLASHYAETDDPSCQANDPSACHGIAKIPAMPAYLSPVTRKSVPPTVDQPESGIRHHTPSACRPTLRYPLAAFEHPDLVLSREQAHCLALLSARSHLCSTPDLPPPPMHTPLLAPLTTPNSPPPFTTCIQGYDNSANYQAVWGCEASLQIPPIDRYPFRAPGRI
ncbi:hypothetical protein BDZ97DRAFT_1914474 [Flammula alnicola]|nr:hypothetical protein BDZ97DRAFT_1914474 [Flammula alnicola]